MAPAITLSFALLFQQQHFSIAEVVIRASILQGYFLPDPHNIRVEVETGILLPQTPIQIAANQQQFSGFSGRGYAVLNYPVNTNVRHTYSYW